METHWFNNREPIAVHIDCLDILIEAVRKASFEYENHQEDLISFLLDIKNILVKISNEEEQK